MTHAHENFKNLSLVLGAVVKQLYSEVKTSKLQCTLPTMQRYSDSLHIILTYANSFQHIKLFLCIINSYSLADRLAYYAIQGKTADEIYSDEVKRIQAKKLEMNKRTHRGGFAMHSGRIQSTSSARRFGGNINPKLLQVKRRLTFDN